MRMILLLLILLSPSCAVKYQDMRLGLGVSAEETSPDLIKISAKLNQLNHPHDLENFLLLRAAEAAKARGANGFIILGSHDQTRIREYYIPGNATSTGTTNLIGGTVFSQTNTQFRPARAMSEIHPAGVIMIRLVRGESHPNILDSDKIIEQIGPLVDRGYANCGLIKCERYRGK